MVALVLQEAQTLLDAEDERKQVLAEQRRLEAERKRQEPNPWRWG